MKEAVVALLVLLLASCEWRSFEVREVHALTGWTQTEGPVGVFSAVSADWSITNRGDMEFDARFGVSVDAADGEAYLEAMTQSIVVEPGDTATGTIIVDTATAEALEVRLIKYKPENSPDPW